MAEEFIQQEENIEEGKFDFKFFASKYILRYWYLYVISIAISLIFIYYYNWYSTPMYSANCSMLIKNEQNRGGGNGDVLGQLNANVIDRNLDNEFEIIKSRSMIRRAIQESDFDVTYILQGKIRKTELYKQTPVILTSDTLNSLAYRSPFKIKVLSSVKYNLTFLDQNIDKEFNKTYRFGERVDCPIGKFTINKTDFFNNTAFNSPSYEKRDFLIRCNTLDALVDHYQQMLRVSKAGANTTIIVLSMSDAVPSRPVDFLNKLVDVYLRAGIEEKNNEIKNIISFIDEELVGLERDLNNAEIAIEVFKTQHGIADVSGKGTALTSSLSDFDNKIAGYDVQLAFMDYMDKYVKDEKDIKQISPASFGIGDELLQKYIGALSELESEKREKVENVKSQNPLLKELEVEIQNAKENLLESIKNVKDGINATKEETKRQRSHVEAEMRLLPGTQKRIY